MEAAEVGRCRGALFMALLFDVGGLSLLLLGTFMDVFFADLLIYSGGVGLLFSLLWWVFWYVGKLEVPPDELQDDMGFGEEVHPMAVPVAMEAEATGRVWRVRFVVRSLGRQLSGSFISKSDKKTEADPDVGETVPGTRRRRRSSNFEGEDVLSTLACSNDDVHQNTANETLTCAFSPHIVPYEWKEENAQKGKLQPSL